jgi:hypothetical protein
VCYYTDVVASSPDDSGLEGGGAEDSISDDTKAEAALVLSNCAANSREAAELTGETQTLNLNLMLDVLQHLATKVILDVVQYHATAQSKPSRACSGVRTSRLSELLSASLAI